MVQIYKKYTCELHRYWLTSYFFLLKHLWPKSAFYNLIFSFYPITHHVINRSNKTSYILGLPMAIQLLQKTISLFQLHWKSLEKFDNFSQEPFILSNVFYYSHLMRWLVKIAIACRVVKSLFRTTRKRRLVLKHNWNEQLSVYGCGRFKEENDSDVLFFIFYLPNVDSII